MLRMKTERIRQGRTQKDLSEATNIPQPNLCAIERGRVAPFPAQAKSIAAELGWEKAPRCLFLEDEGR
jgi:transcriptional regulator with XRE-family HTH domain